MLIYALIIVELECLLDKDLMTIKMIAEYIDQLCLNDLFSVTPFNTL